MKKNPDPTTTTDELSALLEFLVAPDFIAQPPLVDRQAMFRRIEDNMPWRNSRPGEAERRLAEKIPVEFVL